MKVPRIFPIVICMLTIALGIHLHATRVSTPIPSQLARQASGYVFDSQRVRQASGYVFDSQRVRQASGYVFDSQRVRQASGYVFDSQRVRPLLDVSDTEAGLKLMPRQAYVIALTSEIGAEVQASITTALGIQTTVVKADRGWNNAKDMHLFLRYMMDTERYENKLMDTHGQIGCLMSHVHIWENITEPVFVFEEDAMLEAHNNETRNLIANQLFQVSPFFNPSQS